MSKLVVYKASAGSGKTFTLAVSYIELLIKNPQAYKEILAVTFTNKATAEMKERILSQLYGISTADPDSAIYLQKLIESTGKSKEEIQNRSREALTLMLHDYNRFRVETIDSFFQSVMRNLARELELSPNLNVELDGSAVLSDAVDSLIEKLEPKSVVLSWLIEYINEKIADNKRWNVSDDIKNFARNILSEEFIAKGGNLREKLKDTKTIPLYRKELRGIEKDATEQMKGFYEQFHSILQQNGLETKDLKGGMRGMGSYFNKLNNGNFSDDIRNKTVEKSLDNPEEWATKTSTRAQEIITLAAQELIPLLRDAEDFRTKNGRLINSCQLSLAHLNQLQLLAHIDQEMRLLNKEQNRFLLSDTNALLHRLINDGDSSFIFEKIGSSIRNIMIDEFQDTSKMQWDNFQILLLEGLSQGGYSLVVGDVKQSIYRWRNGDWTILNDLGAEGSKFWHFPVEQQSLDTNYRSESSIIHFNNTLFPTLVNELSSRQESESDQRCETLERAYADVAQKTTKTEQKGLVQIEFIKKNDKAQDEDYVENTLVALSREIQRLQDNGVALSDIAILVRKNKSIPAIADYLNKTMQISVVSDEAFRLDASVALNLMIDALRYLSDPSNLTVEANLALNYQSEVLKNTQAKDTQLLQGEIKRLLPPVFINEFEQLKELPLYELLEKLYIYFDLQKISNQDAYLFSFFDKVLDYLQTESSLLDEFITYWDEKLASKTIPSNNVDGIQILSIHKSKGLEFHTVLIPFCDWPIETDRHDQLIWCSPKLTPFNELDIVPVNYGKKMNESIYQEEYLNEQLQLWVDNLNLLYVALTRAGSNLFLFCKQKDSRSISGLIESCLPVVAKKQDIEWTAEAPYAFGTICPSKGFRQKTSTNVFTPTPQKEGVIMQSLPYDFEFKQSNRSADFIAGLEEEESPYRFLNQGKLLHELFASMNALSDLDQAIQKLKFEGVIDSKETEDKIRSVAMDAFSKPEVQEWYSGNWEIFSECAIIYNLEGRLETRRPDRVMVKDNTAIVVDFKFGKKQKSYSGQVREYTKLLEQMGYSPVEGYIWYVKQDSIEKVK